MIKLYKGSELADFNEKFNVTFSIGDIRDLSFGSNNKTYNLNLPLTKTNKRLLKFISQPDVKSEPSETWRLYIGEQLIIQGSILITKHNTLFAEIIINSNDWMYSLKNLKMTDLDLSAYDHALTHANVENSWTAAYPFYRYPMINFGGLVSAEQGATAKWSPNDFIPMFSIRWLIDKILLPYTTASAWLSSTFINTLYILAKEVISDSSFIQNKNLNVLIYAETDNQITKNIVGGTSDSITLYKEAVMLRTITEDQAGAWNSFTFYVIPVSGTYRFIANMLLKNTTILAGNLDITDEMVVMNMILTRATVPTIIQTISSAAYTGTELINAITYSLDSGYYHFLAGDEITVELTAYCEMTNTGGTTRNVALSVALTSSLILVWTNVNKYPGLNKNISAEEMLPDMSQADFLIAIKEIFNLRFWMDKSKRVLYIEPWDQFLSSTVVDLTEFIDFSEDPDTELISPNYNKTIRLKWKDDSSDAAFTEYLKINTAGPGSKDITLTSLFVKSGEDIKEHSFSSLITGYNDSHFQWTVNVPRIWNTVPESPFNTFDRKVGFNTRIVEWKGLTSGFTWHYDSETKTTYPKIQGLDWATIYADYHQKLYHYIDKGKLFTIRMKIKPMFLTQFFTVISNSSAEGFRPTYQINDDYFFLQKVITDGISAELELIIK